MVRRTRLARLVLSLARADLVLGVVEPNLLGGVEVGRHLGRLTGPQPPCEVAASVDDVIDAEEVVGAIAQKLHGLVVLPALPKVGLEGGGVR